MTHQAASIRIRMDRADASFDDNRGRYGLLRNFWTTSAMHRTAMCDMLVRQWMSAEVMTVSPDTSLPEAYRLMKAKDLRVLPVVEDDRLVGLLCIEGIWKAEPPVRENLSIEEMNFQLAIMKVENIMDAQPTCLSPDMNLRQAASRMLTKDARALPVLDEGQLVGVLSERNILQALAETGQAAQQAAADTGSRQHAGIPAGWA